MMAKAIFALIVAPWVANAVQHRRNVQVPAGRASSSGAIQPADTTGANVVNIEIFYETMCPYCQVIIGKSLPQLWNNTAMNERINVTFYPYGNAQTMAKNDVSEGYRFWHEEYEQPGFDYVFACQHGSDECFGNMLHSCIIKEFPEQSTPFVMCTEGYEEYAIEKSSHMCAEALSIDLTKVKACTGGASGNKLMYETGQATEGQTYPAGPPEYSPWVVLDGKHVEDAEMDGGDGESGHLLNAVCSLLNEPKPGLCTASMTNLQSVHKSAKHALDLKNRISASSTSHPSTFNVLRGEVPPPAGKRSEPTDAADVNVVDVQIFYEILCPYCQQIIGKSLVQLYNNSEFNERMNVTLYPFGNAEAVSKDEVSEGYRFWHEEYKLPGFEYVYRCQHGADECFGNMVHACVTKEFPDLSTPFIMCTEGYEEYGIEKSSLMCAEALDMDLSGVKDCTRTASGNQIMYQIAQTTENLQFPAGPREYSPWIVLDGKHVEEAELDGDEAESGHLMREICALLNEPKPTMCTVSASSAKMERLHKDADVAHSRASAHSKAPKYARV